MDLRHSNDEEMQEYLIKNTQDKSYLNIYCYPVHRGCRTMTETCIYLDSHWRVKKRQMILLRRCCLETTIILVEKKKCLFYFVAWYEFREAFFKQQIWHFYLNDTCLFPALQTFMHVPKQVDVRVLCHDLSSFLVCVCHFWFLSAFCSHMFIIFFDLSVLYVV